MQKSINLDQNYALMIYQVLNYTEKNKMNKSSRLTELIQTLVTARKNQKLSQSNLAERASMKQGNLSRIENGQSDLRTGNLIEIARSLSLEVMLIPTQYVPMVSALIKGTNDNITAVPAYGQRFSNDGED